MKAPFALSSLAFALGLVIGFYAGNLLFTPVVPNIPCPVCEKCIEKECPKPTSNDCVKTVKECQGLNDRIENMEGRLGYGPKADSVKLRLMCKDADNIAAFFLNEKNSNNQKNTIHMTRKLAKCLDYSDKYFESQKNTDYPEQKEEYDKWKNEFNKGRKENCLYQIVEGLYNPLVTIICKKP